MSRHTQGSLAIVAAIAAGIFLVALVALMVLGGFNASPAVFIALLVAGVAAIVLYRGFAGDAQVPFLSTPASKSAPTPEPRAEAAPAPQAERASEATPAPASEPAPAAVDVVIEDPIDGGSIDDAGEGTRPAALDAPLGGKPDDLKQIKGIGPKLEKLCNSLGFWHFEQIANWSAEEVAWVDANLEGFKGRVTRDNWVPQAKVLAAGGETEFSKRVGDGGVY